MTHTGGSPWSTPQAVAGFENSPPNPVLMRFAKDELARGGIRALDLGCGAGRNAVPFAQQGWDVAGIDDSAPMLQGASRRARAAGIEARVHLALATMERVPVRDASFDLVVAHGIWNLARTTREFRGAVREAARVSKPGAGLFVFTFSRHTLSAEARPLAGEAFVHTKFSGQPQCFLREQELLNEMAAAGFEPHPGVPLTEYNRPAPGSIRVAAGPVILEAGFRLRGQPLLA
jgi:ubiquinone/menaquinone biosynthesis C-methylase UbiE